MKVFELVKAYSSKQKVFGIIDIHLVVERQKAEPFLFSEGFFSNTVVKYYGKPVGEYEVVSWGIYSPSNFSFATILPPSKDFLVIDIDSRELHLTNVVKNGFGNATSWDSVTEHLKLKNDMISALYPDMYDFMTMAGFRPNKQPTENKVAVPKINATLVGVPQQVFFNDEKKTTTIIYDDKLRPKPFIVKASGDDVYKRRIGFLEAFFQANCGLSKNKALKYLKELEDMKSVGKKKEEKK